MYSYFEHAWGSFIADWWIKLPVAVVLGQILPRILGLFEAKFEFVAIVAILILVDLVTGLFKAASKKTLSSNKLRQTGWKVMQYTVLLLMLQGVANAFEIVSFLADTGFLYVALVEVTSIVENLFGTKSTASQIWRTLRKNAEDRTAGEIIKLDE